MLKKSIMLTVILFSIQAEASLRCTWLETKAGAANDAMLMADQASKETFCKIGNQFVEYANDYIRECSGKSNLGIQGSIGIMLNNISIVKQKCQGYIGTVHEGNQNNNSNNNYQQTTGSSPSKRTAKRASIIFKCNVDGVINTITFSKNTIYIDNGRYEAIGSHLSFNKPNVFELGHGAGSVKFENRKITFIPDTDDPSKTYRCQKIRK